MVVGEALFDLVPAGGESTSDLVLGVLAGGGPANTAVGLARLGVPTAFAGRLSTGGLGPRRRRLLADEGVDLALSVDAAEPATLTVVSLDATGGATYELYGPGTADWQWSPAELPDPLLLPAAAVHTGTLATILEPSASVLTGWLAEVRRRGDVVVSYDPNVRLSIVPDLDRYRRAVASFVACAHVVKASEDDIAALWPDRSVEDVIAGWLGGTTGPSVVAVTRGAAGSVACLRGGDRVASPAPAVEVVDTVGAGDAFVAGFLAHLWAAGRLSPGGLEALDPSAAGAALDWANEVAARCCSRPGADPPRAGELSARG